MLNSKYNIIIIEDDIAQCKLIYNKLHKENYSIKSYSSGLSVLNIEKINKKTIFLIDYNLYDISSYELIEKLKLKFQNINFIIMTALSDETVIVDMMKLGAIDFIIKDIDFFDLLPGKIEKAILDFEKRNEIEESKRKINTLINYFTDFNLHYKLYNDYSISLLTELNDISNFKNKEYEIFVSLLINNYHNQPKDDILKLKILRKKLLKGAELTSEFRIFDEKNNLNWYRAYLTSEIVEGQDYVKVFGAYKNITKEKEKSIEESKIYQFENLISNISQLFISSDYKNFNKSVNLSLELIGNFINVDRVYIFEYSNNQKTFSNTYEWTSENAEPHIQNLQNLDVSSFKWWNKHILKDKIALISDINNYDELPREAVVERSEFERENIKSILGFPLKIKAKIYGFIGFDAVREKRTWDSFDISILKSLCNILSNVIEKRNLQIMIQENEKKYRNYFNKFSKLADNINDILYLINKNGNIELLNKANDKIWKFDFKKLINNDTRLELVHPLDRDYISKQLDDYFSDDLTIFDEQYRILLPNNKTEWIWTRLIPIIDNNNNLEHIAGIETIITDKQIAIENLKEYSSAQSKLKDFISYTFNILNLKFVINKIIQETFELPWLNLIKQACIFLKNENTDEYELYLDINLSTYVRTKCKKIIIGRCLCGKVIETGRKIIKTNIDSEHDIYFDGKQPHGHYIAPLNIGNKTLGVFNLYVENDYRLKENEIQFLDAVVDIIANIINFKQNEEKIYYLNRAFNSKNNELNELIKVSTHDIKTPLVNIRGFSELIQNTVEKIEELVNNDKNKSNILKSDLVKILNEDLKVSSTYISDSIKNMDVTLSGIVEFYNLTNYKPVCAKIDSNIILEKLIRDNFSEYSNNIFINKIHKILADEYLIIKIFYNIIKNAILFKKTDNDLKINIFSLKDESFTKIIFEDNGIGIDEMSLRFIYNIYYIGGKKNKGRGLGLPFSKKAIELQNGNILIESKVNMGTKIILTFPNV